MEYPQSNLKSVARVSRIHEAEEKYKTLRSAGIAASRFSDTPRGRVLSRGCGFREVPNLSVPGRGREIWNRRIFLLAAHPGEGLFSQQTAAAQAWRPELVFMPLLGLSASHSERLLLPLSGHRRSDGEVAESGGLPTLKLRQLAPVSRISRRGRPPISARLPYSRVPSMLDSLGVEVPCPT